MSKKITINDILQSKSGKLNQQLINLHPKKKKAVKGLKIRNDCNEVKWMHWQLKYWCIEKGVRLEKEFKFAKERRYRADFALPGNMILLEYEGIFSEHSRHTNNIGYSKDTEKYSLAATLGYKILRYTKLNYKNVLQDLEKIIKLQI